MQDQNLPVTHYHDIYPGIDPAKYTNSRTGNVVFITGASRGIGEATARAFAQSGASLFLAARNTKTLEEVSSAIVKSFPNSKVGHHATDVSSYEDVKAAVEACVTMFGKIDVVVSNSGIAEPVKKLHESDPTVWWRTWEVNVKGCFNVAHCTLPLLMDSKGYLIFTTSVGAQHVNPGMSAYATGKHALNRIAEFIVQESGETGVKVFPIHPGAILTEIAKDVPLKFRAFFKDTVELPAWTMVRLVSGSEDFLSGRYISCNWDLDEVAAKFKESIVREDALKHRLLMPKL